MSQRYMRHIVFLAGLLALQLISVPSRAETNSCADLAHSLAAGQVVSADVMTELFCAIVPDLATTLVGTWSTECWDSVTTDINSPGTGTLTISSLTSITFSNDSGNPYDSCLVDSDEGITTFPFTIRELKVVGNHAVIVSHTKDGVSTVRTRAWNIIELTKDTILISSGSFNVIRMARTIRPPSAPTILSASVSSGTVTLAWTDNSSDETSFKIIRRDSLLGTYSTVTTAATNASSYSETLSAGTYWYRVQATNANGDSLGTNVVKVTVE